MLTELAVNRRRLLGAATMLAGGVALSPLAAVATTPAPRRRLKALGEVSETEWSRLAKGLTTGKLLRPWDADFNLVALPNNMRYAAVLPEGIARCGSARDVAFAVTWARDNHVPLATRGGGHSYAGYSTTGGLMIETAWMNRGAYHPDSGVASIGAGARNRDLYRLLRQHDRATTHGRCPSVGAAGFLLGGGIGFNMRARGVASDHLIASEMVLADGSIHRLSAHARDRLDVDLFWASRGVGGGNLGISTNFALETFSVAGQSVTVFDLTWRRTPDDKISASVEAVGLKLMEQFEHASTALGSRISFGAVTPAQLDQGYDVSISALGQYAGPRRELEAILAPVYDLAKPNGGRGIQELPYWPAQDFLHEDGYAAYYQERSVFVNRAFGADELAAGLKSLRQWPGTGAYCDLRFFQTGGAINNVAADATAFVHRDSRWLMVVGLYWSELDEHDEARMHRNHAWQDRFYEQMRPIAGGGAYQNFADPSLTDYREAYYGRNLARLQAIKQRVDPGSLFQFPQAV